MAAGPLILPATFSGEKGYTWTEWKYPFQYIATVNEWTDAEGAMAAGSSHWPSTKGDPTFVGSSCSIS